MEADVPPHALAVAKLTVGWLALIVFPHSLRQGDDLHMDVDVDLSDALLGFTTTVKGIDDKTLPVRRTLD